MDDATYQGLRAALAATPDNDALLGVVVQGAVTLGHLDDAVALIRAASVPLPEGARGTVGTALAEHAPELALDLLTDQDPPTLVARARALLALGRPDDARTAYHTATRANATLQDPALEERLREPDNVVSFDGRPALRVLSQETGPESPVSPEIERPTVTFDDVGGLDELKRRIHRKIILPMTKPGLLARFKRKSGGGVLLYGPPGCGKTLMARATAGETGATFLNVQISDVLDKWMGVSEERLHGFFEQARAHTPSVLFFDEVEALGGKRQHHQSPSMANLVSQFLSEMDGFDSHNEGVLVLAATNVPWSVDPAFRRPGRFDRVLFVPPPDHGARTAILGIHLSDRPLAPDVDLDTLAKATRGYSGADLEHVVDTAADFAIDESLEREQEVPISAAHLRDAVADVRPSVSEWLATARNYARYANEGGQYDEVLQFLKAFGKAKR